ncbi:MAG: hypothetical protein LBC44_00895 [Mycoplasmataceae bacterium]|jgi:hypothetical protein|nr:hypothetical protein [Mycoplasmataceae bacterium]
MKTKRIIGFPVVEEEEPAPDYSKYDKMSKKDLAYHLQFIVTNPEEASYIKKMLIK